MIKSRVIARNLGLEMKVGDVEFQADKRKATFYYTADGRVDFRELIKQYAREFRIKIEMRQIGARQESSRIGGVGSCGRELCCSTWLTNFKSVSTAVARYQNLAINQSKLSGQCGRLKCCLNYELDTYLDALKAFPKRADSIETEAGKAVLVKTDIFRGLMFYVYENSLVNKFYPVPIKRVKEIIAMNKKGKKPVDLFGTSFAPVAEEETGFGDVTGVVELPPEERRRRKGRNRKKGKGRSGNRPNNSGNKGKESAGGRTSGKSPKGKSSGKPSNSRSGKPNKEKSAKGNENKPKGNRRPDNRKPKPQNRKGRGPRKQNPPTDKPKE